MKKKVTILFGDVFLSYSPTVLGLYDLLSQHFDVTIIARSPEFFDNQPVTGRNVISIKQPVSYLARLFKLAPFYLSSIFDNKAKQLRRTRFSVSTFYEFKFIQKYLAAKQSDFIIAVDFKNLFITQLLGKKVEFLSLEIVPNDPYYAACDFKNIDCVIIQTKERYEHLFGDKKLKTFYVQNAPIYVPVEAVQTRKGLVYCGTAWDRFGFYHCLEFLKQYPSCSMNVRGAILSDDKMRVDREYGDLLASGRLVIDDEYLNEKALTDYLRNFRIGFSFYNFEIEQVDNFNYQSAPSGKMFKYFAAGVPVIALDTIGSQPIAEFDCGVLIRDLKPASIKQAVDKIESNFDYYSQNCLRAAGHYSFDKMAKPFLDYLMSTAR